MFMTAPILCHIFYSFPSCIQFVLSADSCLQRNNGLFSHMLYNSILSSFLVVFCFWELHVFWVEDMSLQNNSCFPNTSVISSALSHFFNVNSQSGDSPRPHMYFKSEHNTQVVVLSSQQILPSPTNPGSRLTETSVYARSTFLLVYLLLQ